MSLRPLRGDERRRSHVPPSATQPSRLKTVLDVGKANTRTYPAVSGPRISDSRPIPVHPPDDAPKPYVGPEPKPSYRWDVLRRTRPFRAYVDEELGMGTSVDFTPGMDGTMGAVVTPNTNGGLRDMLAAWFYQSQWHFSGPPGQEMPTQIVLPSGDILYPEFVQYENGDMYLKSYGYLGKEDGTVAYMERAEDGTYKPADDTTDGAKGTNWTDYVEFCMQGVLVCISWLLVAVANNPYMQAQAQAVAPNGKLFGKLKRGQEKRKRVLEGPWRSEYASDPVPKE